MDALSAVFASYLDAVSTITAKHMTDVIGTEVEAVIIEHDGYQVPFKHQMWRINERSICDNYRQEMTQFAGCTVAAKDLFERTCHHLQVNPDEHWKHKKLKNMYCNAAVSFQPTIANLQWSKQEGVALADAQQACSLATLEAVNHSNAETGKRRDQACEDYARLKGASGQ